MVRAYARAAGSRIGGEAGGKEHRSGSPSRGGQGSHRVQLHTVVGVHMHTTALKLASERTVYDKLLWGICGGHINIVDRQG